MTCAEFQAPTAWSAVIDGITPRADTALSGTTAPNRVPAAFAQPDGNG